MQLEIILIASVVSANCALVGSFLVLRKMVMISDAISHSILLGIVLAYLFTRSRDSATMLIAATLTGVLTVFLVEALQKSRLVKEDAAIGLVFPALFSIGVILLSRHLRYVHLCTESVILGELAFAPFRRMIVAGRDIGPQTLWLALSTGAASLGFILLFFKELKIVIFDSSLAITLGISPLFVHYGLMTLVSGVAVSSFEAVGSILVVALMVAPPAASYLLTDKLVHMIGIAVGLGVLSSIGGYFLAYVLDVSISGSVSTIAGLIFLVVFFFSPRRGLIRQRLLNRCDSIRFAEATLLLHLNQHGPVPALKEGFSQRWVIEGMNWHPAIGTRAISSLFRQGLITCHPTENQVQLTEKGTRALMDGLTALPGESGPPGNEGCPEGIR